MKKYLILTMAICLPMMLVCSCSKDDEDNLIGWYYNNQTIDESHNKPMWQKALHIIDGNTLQLYSGLFSITWKEQGKSGKWYAAEVPVVCSLGTWYTRIAPDYCTYYVVDNKLYAPTCSYPIWTITKEGLVPDGLVWNDGASPVFVKK